MWTLVDETLRIPPKGIEDAPLFAMRKVSRTSMSRGAAMHSTAPGNSDSNSLIRSLGTPRSCRHSNHPTGVPAQADSGPDFEKKARKANSIGQAPSQSDRKSLKNGAPGEIRTPDRLVRSQVLYPTELRAHIDIL